MNRGLYSAASGAVAALLRLDSASQNMANVNTAGYKAERQVFRLRPLDQGPRGAFDPTLGKTGAQVIVAGTVRDFSPGAARPTGNPLDVALESNGFFVVATARGERYTRNGAFTRDGEGYLVTQRGERVQGTSGDLRLDQGEVTIADDGSVSVDRNPVGRLRVVAPVDPRALVAEGASLFAAAPTAAPPGAADDATTHVRQGALEGANIDAVRGMIELVDVARGFDTYMHTLRRLDEITQRTINEVGRVG